MWLLFLPTRVDSNEVLSPEAAFKTVAKVHFVLPDIECFRPQTGVTDELLVNACRRSATGVYFS